MIPVYEPYLPSKSLRYAHEALDSGWISWRGKFRDMASERLCDLMGVKYVLLTSSGTTAAHLTAKCFRFRYPGISKIFLPNNVYVAAWNVFVYDGIPYEYSVMDVDLDTWNMVPPKEADNSLVLAVHNLGNVVNIPKLKQRMSNTVFVEDACEALFGEYEGKAVGTESLCASFSFFGNKNVTCGEGGALVTNDEELYQFANNIHGQGQSETQYVHDLLGYNYRMTNVQAAILYGQLEIIDEIRERKDALFDKYRGAFLSCDHVAVQKIENGTSHSKWMFGIRIKGSSGYEKIQGILREDGIETRPMFYQMSSHAHLSFIKARDETNACTLSRECLMLPSYPAITDEDSDKVIESVKKLSKHLGGIH